MADGIGAHGGNFYRADGNLQALLRRSARWLSEDDGERLSDFGAWAATAVDEQADYTNRFAPPLLETLDEGGRARSAVRHNPLYAAVHREVYERGIVGLNYGRAPRPYALTFAMGYLLAQADISVHCPATLTGAVAHVLDRFAPKTLRDAWLPALVRMDGGPPAAAPGSPRNRAAAMSAPPGPSRGTPTAASSSAASNGSPAMSTAGSRSPSPGRRAHRAAAAGSASISCPRFVRTARPTATASGGSRRSSARAASRQGRSTWRRRMRWRWRRRRTGCGR